ncbi:hypothetical protein ATANTOWER_022653 [Ataeniobius toweri]|uniref:Uncharacterized protein n=1 Tax=Ataeniobius toweri TaxID=208326 RepID=A0ABU7A7P4_9TELE|nr:hypothetical protein [Ataeniobius toweri]
MEYFPAQLAPHNMVEELTGAKPMRHQLFYVFRFSSLTLVVFSCIQLLHCCPPHTCTHVAPYWRECELQCLCCLLMCVCPYHMIYCRIGKVVEQCPSPKPLLGPSPRPPTSNAVWPLGMPRSSINTQLIHHICPSSITYLSHRQSVSQTVSPIDVLGACRQLRFQVYSHTDYFVLLQRRREEGQPVWSPVFVLSFLFVFSCPVSTMSPPLTASILSSQVCRLKLVSVF